MKNEILNYIEKNGGVSYVEIENIFEENGFDWKGDLEICSSENSNIVFWAGWNEAACEIIKGLQKGNLITRSAANNFIYMVDGKTLNLPVAKRNYNYKNKHWIPSVFNIVKK